jgi:mono/diheme cytochrome c family protein
MKPVAWVPGVVALALCGGCSSRHAAVPALHATTTGSAVVESSGGKQLGSPGTMLAQPLVVQVNDKQGNPVTGALVNFGGPSGVIFDPPQGLTDSSGQASTQVTLGGIAGRYELTASSIDAGGKTFVLNIAELAAGYQQQLGNEIEETNCARCHDPESTTQRVSNFDNLAVKPHPFNEGDVLNKLSDSDLTAIISHGGQSVNESALMPPYGATLSKPEVQALIAYIRLVSDPPYKPAGVVYAKR